MAGELGSLIPKEPLEAKTVINPGWRLSVPKTNVCPMKLKGPFGSGIILGIAFGVVVLVAIIGWAKYLLATIELAQVEGRAGHINSLRNEALTGTNVTECARLLYGVQHFYAVRKVEPSDKLQLLLDQVREPAINEIIQHLRRLSGIDLGENPGPWVERFAPEMSRGTNQ